MSENVIRSRVGDWRDQSVPLDDFTAKITAGSYDLNPEHQRNVIRDNEWKSGIIQSILQEGDIPPVYFHTRYDKDNHVIYESLDGKQRSSAIYEFMSDKYPYTESSPEGMRGKKYSEIPTIYQSMLIQFTIPMRICTRTMTPSEIQKFFKKRQDHRVTKKGEHLNSCIASEHRPIVNNFIVNNEAYIKNIVPKNDRFQRDELIVPMLYIYVNNHDIKYLNVKPEEHIKWYSNYPMLEESEINNFNNSASELIKILSDAEKCNLKKTTIKSCIVPLFKLFNEYVFVNNSKISPYYDKFINNIINKQPIRFEIADVGGKHNSSEERYLKFKEAIIN
tara:strand:+ start:413 stop:1414 length:1002 start_codon:yes stop_codon:yes gene_type:complete